MAEQEMSRLDAIAEGLRDKRPLDLDPLFQSWEELITQERARVKPMVDAIREDAQPLVLALLRDYETGDDATRKTIRRLFASHRNVTYSIGSGAREYRQRLIWIAATDEYRDPRDTVVAIDEVIKDAVAHDFDIAPILEDIAAMAADVSDAPYPSTRRAMHNACDLLRRRS